MSTIYEGNFSKFQTKRRLAVVIDPKDASYYDYANDRPKSGFFEVTINSLTAINPPSVSEVMKARLKFPNHDPKHNGPIADKTAVIGLYLSWGDVFRVAYNYGIPGPNAQVLPSGLIDLVGLDVELAQFTNAGASGLTLALDSTVTFTEVDPTTAITGLTAATLEVSAYEDYGRDLDIFQAPTLAGYKALVVQLSSISLAAQPGCGCGASVGANVVVSAPGLGDALYQGAIANGQQTVQLPRDYTRVFAINDSKLDQAAGLHSVSSGTKKFTPVSLALGGRGNTSASLSFGYKLIS